MTSPQETADEVASLPEFVEVRFSLPATTLPLLEPVLWTLSPGGILTEDAGTLGARDLPAGDCRVAVYVSPADLPVALEELRTALARHGAPFAPQLQDIERQDWNRVWKAHFHAFDMGRRLRIVPEWEQQADARALAAASVERVSIAIDPGMAFGTGTHETTRLALCTVEAWADAALGAGENLHQQRVLDVGTGSGILAIEAVLLGAGSAVGTENDAEALENAAVNLRLNGVADRVRLLHCEDPSGLGQFELVIANIISSVLLELLPHLVAALAPSGVLVLSGILYREVDDVREAYVTAGLSWLETQRDGEWCSLRLRSPA
jgi:ribosomal protein L11 methyltransferase